MSKHPITRLAPELAIAYFEAPSLDDDLVNAFLTRTWTLRALIMIELPEDSRTRLLAHAKVEKEHADELVAEMEQMRNFQEGKGDELTDEQDRMFKLADWTSLEELCTILANKEINWKDLAIIFKDFQEMFPPDEDITTNENTIGSNEDGSSEKICGDAEEEVQTHDDKKKDVNVMKEEGEVAGDSAKNSTPARRRAKRPAS
jgi:hypothetical protein